MGNMMHYLKRIASLLVFVLWLALNVTTACAEIRKPTAEEIEQIETSPIWQKIRASLFADRKINIESAGLFEFDVPIRAEDSAIVPVAIRTKFVASPERYIRRITLVIDKNPSPISATFSFTPESGRADIETRVRIEEYTPIRAIAEMNNGEIFMSARFIKASGGCSAPAGKDAVAALANVGKMRLRLEGAVRFGQPNLAQIMISHPNSSGLAMDQVTRLYEPAYFVRNVEVSYAGKSVLSADVDFSISENPNFRFYFVPEGPGELKAEVTDTKGKTFKTHLTVEQSAATTGPRAP